MTPVASRLPPAAVRSAAHSPGSSFLVPIVSAKQKKSLTHAFFSRGAAGNSTGAMVPIIGSRRPILEKMNSSPPKSSHHTSKTRPEHLRLRSALCTQTSTIHHPHVHPPLSPSRTARFLFYQSRASRIPFPFVFCSQRRSHLIYSLQLVLRPTSIVCALLPTYHHSALSS